MPSPIARAVLLAFASLPFAAHAQTAIGAAAPPSSSSSSSSASSADASAKPAAVGSADIAGESGALSPVVVTAERGPQPLADAIPQTTLFDRQDLADTAATDLPGLLQLAPGAQVSRSGGPGSTASLFLRGASATQSLVLIDGVRVDSVSLGAAQLAQIPLDQLDRVEVVNGNVSALYGSGAIGGVVQVWTKDGGAHPPRFDFSVGFGSYRTQTQQAGVSGALDTDGKTTFSLSLARSKDDGFSSIDPARAPAANPNANGYLNESLSASLRHTFSNGWDAGVRYFQSNGNDSYDNAFGAPADLNNLYSKVRQMSVFANGKLADWWTTHLTVSEGDDRSVSDTNGVYSGRFDTDNRQYTWQNDFAFAAQQKLQAGYEHLDQRLGSDAYAAPERHVDSGFVGYTGRFGRSRIQANLRHDQYSVFGGANSYYLGYGFDLSDRWKATASYSDAFRAPGFDDLYYPFSGNPALQPERSHSIEAALQYASGALGVLRLSVFQTRYANLIDYPQVAPGVYLAGNVGRAKVQGFEGSWSGHLGKTEVRASVTLQNPVDEDNDVDLVRRARRFASLAVNRSIAGWRIGGEWLVSSARTDSDGPLGGYGVVNLSARYAITRAWYVAAHIQNLFDRNYETAYTYNSPRRGAYLTLGWQQQ